GRAGFARRTAPRGRDPGLGGADRRRPRRVLPPPLGPGIGRRGRLPDPLARRRRVRGGGALRRPGRPFEKAAVQLNRDGDGTRATSPSELRTILIFILTMGPAIWIDRILACRGWRDAIRAAIPRPQNGGSRWRFAKGSPSTT